MTGCVSAPAGLGAFAGRGARCAGVASAVLAWVVADPVRRIALAAAKLQTAGRNRISGLYARKPPPTTPLWWAGRAVNPQLLRAPAGQLTSGGWRGQTPAV